MEDDGRGISPKIIQETLLEKALVSPEIVKKMTEAQLYDSIFLPGFSTTPNISTLSGRGVGMDVVRHHIEKVGGSLQVTSEEGVGTTITLSLPLTLSIVDSLIVQVGNQPFALPKSSIEMILFLKKEAKVSQGRPLP